MADLKSSYSGSIPEYYDNCLGPAWFDAFAQDLARRVPSNPRGNVLEIACGTGLVTRYLRERLDPTLRLFATDISKAMLDYARDRIGERGGIEWREADAAKLPFADGAFGAVVCSFGVMFVPDKQAAFSEARRVLVPGGVLIFNVWDRIEDNPCARVNAEVVEAMFPGDAELRFTTPYEMHDPSLLRQYLADARFNESRLERIGVRVDNVSAHSVAEGQIRGSPRSLLIGKRGVPLEEVVDRVTEALAKMGGADPLRARANAIVVEAVAAF